MGNSWYHQREELWDVNKKTCCKRTEWKEVMNGLSRLEKEEQSHSTQLRIEIICGRRAEVRIHVVCSLAVLLTACDPWAALWRMAACTFVGWFVWERAPRTMPGEGPVVCGAAQFLLVWEGSFLPVLSGFTEHECTWVCVTEVTYLRRGSRNRD